MRTRLSAALLLVLSWFLPATAHAQVVQQVAAVQAVSWRAEQQQSGMRQVPHPAPAMRAWTGLHGVTGPGAAVLDAGLPGFRHPWAAIVASGSADAPALRRPIAAPARAPPSAAF
ncbi:hypothetical protein [Nonomuraea sp. NPDC050643]|uniref:hypothetical protein n=1 Tax=Nonomuraea sp. NPDC050643 TaxID=3155660 RepID=UPI0033FA0E85